MEIGSVAQWLSSDSLGQRFQNKLIAEFKAKQPKFGRDAFSNEPDSWWNCETEL